MNIFIITYFLFILILYFYNEYIDFKYDYLYKKKHHRFIFYICESPFILHHITIISIYMLMIIKCGSGSFRIEQGKKNGKNDIVIKPNNSVTKDKITVNYEIPDTMPLRSLTLCKITITSNLEYKTLSKVEKDSLFNVSNRISVIASGVNKDIFAITALSTQEQIIEDKKITFWTFGIIPFDYDNHSLFFLVKEHYIDLDKKPAEHDLSLKKKSIFVSCTEWQKVQIKTEKNWNFVSKALIFTIFLSLIIGISTGKILNKKTVINMGNNEPNKIKILLFILFVPILCILLIIGSLSVISIYSIDQIYTIPILLFIILFCGISTLSILILVGSISENIFSTLVIQYLSRLSLLSGMFDSINKIFFDKVKNEGKKEDNDEKNNPKPKKEHQDKPITQTNVPIPYHVGEVTNILHFDLDSTEIKEIYFKDLDNLTKILNDYRNIKKIHIIGHCDTTGQEEHNNALARDRAYAVYIHLVINCNVMSGRLQSYGLGSTALANDETSKNDRALNRRVEIKIAEII